jgi:DNA-binding MarR family transcriptional regulator
VRVIDLLATLAVTKQALHVPLQQLVRKKLVQSRAAPSNLRERRLTLTTSGKALEKSLSGHQRRAFASAFHKVGASKAQGWRAVMRELVNAAPADRR